MSSSPSRQMRRAQTRVMATSVAKERLDRIEQSILLAHTRITRLYGILSRKFPDAFAEQTESGLWVPPGGES